MNIKETLMKNIHRLPGLREPKYNSLLDVFLDEYGFSFMNADKTQGDINAYYKALDNVYVSRCVQVYCDESIYNGFRINNPDEEQVDNYTTKYLQNLFNNPQGVNNEATFSMLNSQIWTSWLITGDCFLEVNMDKLFDNVPIGFKYIPTELIGYHEDTDQWGLRNTGYRYENDEIIHIYKPSIKKRNYKWGTSLIDTIGLSIAVEFLGMLYNKDILADKGLDPKGILSFDIGLNETRVNSEIRRLKQTQNKKGTIAVQGATYQKMAASNKDMDFISLMNYSRDRIITAFGVQPSKIGVRETANLGSGTGESQNKDFQKILYGKCKFIEDQFNKVLGRHGFHEVFEYVREDNENKQLRTEIEDKKIRNGSLTINESRAGYGLEPVEWGEVPMNYTQYGVTTSSSNGKVEPLAETNGGGMEKSINSYYSLEEQLQNIREYKNKLYKANVLSEFNKE